MAWAAVPGRARVERRVFISDESGRRDFVLDASTNTVKAQIDLGEEAGNTQYDPGSHCVIVAVQTANQLALIDPATARSFAEAAREAAVERACREAVQRLREIPNWDLP